MRGLGRVAMAAGGIVLAGYLLAIVRCECGLMPIGDALSLVLPWSIVRYYFLIPLAMMAIELAAVGWRDSSLAVILRWSPSVRVDAFYLMIQMWLVMPIIMATTGGLYWHAEELTKQYSLRLAVIEAPLVQGAIVFLVGDFVSYWVHRLMHKSAALWEAHKVHHSATDLNLMIAFRFHPLETTVLQFTSAAIFLLLGATLDTFVAFSFVHMLLGQIQHARVNWNYGLLGKVLVSPAFHRFHHSQHRQDFDHNFGARLVLWDWLFGTYSTRKLRPDEIGVDDNTYVDKSLLAEFFRPYYIFFVNISAAVRGALSRPVESGVEKVAD
jgi:sterol desaturase/sphingolipid hydroxylase (fatty acid hydroxylase superfamily)